MTLGASWFWPDVSSRKNALFAIDEAFWVAIFVSAFTTVLAVVEILRSAEPVSYEGFLDAAFLAGIAFGIRWKSRIAALLGLAVYVFSRGYYIWTSGVHGNLVLPLFVALALVHGVRGTFAYHRFPPIPGGTPNIEQSFKAFGQNRQGDSGKIEKD